MRIFVVYEGELIAYIKLFGLFKIKLYPKKEPKRYLKKHKTEKKKTKTVKPIKKGAEKTEKKRKGIKETVEDLLRLVKIILKRLSYRVKVRVYDLDIVVATDDPAKTALVYSAVCNSLDLFTELLTGYDKLEYRVDSMSCRCDFLSEKFSFGTKIEIRSRISNILLSAIGILLDIINKK